MLIIIILWRSAVSSLFKKLSCEIFLLILFLFTENESQVCSTECTSAGCWGSGPDQCLECNHFKYNGTCLSDCSNLPR